MAVDSELVAAVVERVLAGDRRAAARLMRDVDDEQPGAREILALLHRHAGRAHVVGITGNPGAGKSTLIDQLIRSWRGQGRKVGVAAIDPSSPFTGGAILGDRIRMQDHALDPGVFIRSLATRGHLGGLTRSTDDVITILDAMGHDVVIVETVGVGQDEVDIVRSADSVVVVLAPGLGDEVQALKAGILEIADLFVVNKADRDGANRAAGEIEAMLALRDVSTAALAARRDAAWHHGMGSATSAHSDGAGGSWNPPVLRTVSTRGEGIAALVESLAQHCSFQERSGQRLVKAEQRAHDRLVRVLREGLWERAVERLGGPQALAATVDAIVRRADDPYTAAAALLAKIG